jgi:hypothetical protein
VILAVFNEELVYMSILRQHIDTSNTFRLNPPLTLNDQGQTTKIAGGMRFAQRQPKLEQKLMA